MNDLLPPGPELFAHNRRVTAERLNWPADAVANCEKIDRMQPGWHTSYHHAWRDSRAGYYAFHDHRTWMEDHLYGATPEELGEAIRAHRCASR